MPWSPDEAERHTHKATTTERKSFGLGSPMKAWKAPATKAAPSEKRTRLSLARRSAAKGPVTVVRLLSFCFEQEGLLVLLEIAPEH
jgi:hypothetical protein